MADPTYVRMYESRLRHLKEKAAADAASLAEDAVVLARRIADSKGGYGSEAAKLSAQYTHLFELIGRIEILEEVSYLTTDPDAAEEG